jgi:hypothetical protein
MVGMVNGIGVQQLSRQDAVQAVRAGRADEVDDATLKSLKRSGAVQCSTCASRKYQDGSDEANVSYKAPGNISPSESAAKVSSHESEHVSNAYDKAEKAGGKVVNASVSIKTAICPECGRSYVSGGVTHTAIKYPKGKYGDNQKSLDYQSVVGANVDESV